MTENAFIVPPRSRRAIRQITGLVREHCGCTGPKLDIMHVVEFWLPVADEGFSLEVMSRQDLGDIHGLAAPYRKAIQIREDVYHGALDDRGRDRMTVAHELGHYVLHRGANLARMPQGGHVPPYLSSEWQANTFAAELLISFDHVIHCQDESELPGLFGVTREAARVQWAVLRQEGVKK